MKALLPALRMGVRHRYWTAWRAHDRRRAAFFGQPPVLCRCRCLSPGGDLTMVQDVPAVRQSSCLCSGRWNRHGPHHAVSPLIPSKRFHEGPNRLRCRHGGRLEAISASGDGKGHHMRSRSSGNFSIGEGVSNYLSSEAVEGAFAWYARASINGKRRRCAGRSWEKVDLGAGSKRTRTLPETKTIDPRK